MSGRVVELAALMRPTAALRSMQLAGSTSPVDRQAKRSPVSGSHIELRLHEPGPEHKLPPGTHLWGIVEVWPSGHEELLLGSHKPSAVEAMTAGMPHYERLRAERGR